MQEFNTNATVVPILIQSIFEVSIGLSIGYSQPVFSSKILRIPSGTIITTWSLTQLEKNQNLSGHLCSWLDRSDGVKFWLNILKRKESKRTESSFLTTNPFPGISANISVNVPPLSMANLNFSLLDIFTKFSEVSHFSLILNHRWSNQKRHNPIHY